MEQPLVQRPRTDRVPVVRPVSYEILTRLETEESDGEVMRGNAVLLNISQGGMLLLMSGAVSVQVPLLVDHTAYHDVGPAHGLGEVVWTCPVFFAPQLHFVGVRFLQ
jgi:hypothetical protein